MMKIHVRYMYEVHKYETITIEELVDHLEEGDDIDDVLQKYYNENNCFDDCSDEPCEVSDWEIIETYEEIGNKPSYSIEELNIKDLIIFNVQKIRQNKMELLNKISEDR